MTPGSLTWPPGRISVAFTEVENIWKGEDLRRNTEFDFEC